MSRDVLKNNDFPANRGRYSQRDLTIGEMAERTGLTVKTLRFYANAGLLPPSGRSEGNYRLFTLDDVMRALAIRSLREAGFTIREIGAVLGCDLPLKEALSLRLAAVEAQMKALKRVASALRLALRSDPSEDDLRRLLTVTRLSNADRKAAIEQFYARVSEGIAISPEWRREMIEASVPDLPDDPSPEQLEAWIELSGMISDPGFIEAMRNNAREVWTADFDQAAYRRAWGDITGRVNAAMAAGLGPDAPEAATILADWLAAYAAAMGRAPDDAFKAWWREKIETHDERATRYWELVAVLRGTQKPDRYIEGWAWMKEAARLHLGLG
jgi:DNA-binding transcriptional MerR regulator